MADVKACPGFESFGEDGRAERAQRQRVSHKLQLCPERYLPIIEAAIDGAIKMEE